MTCSATTSSRRSTWSCSTSRRGTRRSTCGTSAWRSGRRWRSRGGSRRSRRPIWIRHVVVPGWTDDEATPRGIAEFAASLGNVERVDVLPFHQMGRYKWSNLNMTYRLDARRAAVRRGRAALDRRIQGRGTARVLTMLWKLCHRVHADGHLRGHPCLERDVGDAVGADARHGAGADAVRWRASGCSSGSRPGSSPSTSSRSRVWATFYWWKGAMPDLPSSIYFSAVTYTTTGYGDLVLPADWRLVGGVEALTGHPDVRLVHRLLLRGREWARTGRPRRGAPGTPDVVNGAARRLRGTAAGGHARPRYSTS